MTTKLANNQLNDVSRVFNVRDYGATGDGVTDDYAAIEAALVDARLVGGRVYFPTVEGQNPTYYNHSQTLFMNSSGLELVGESTRVNLRYTGSTVGIKGHPYTPFSAYRNGTTAVIDPIIEDWVTSTAYTAGTIIKNAGVYYLALVNHTSTSITADLTAENIAQYGYTYENMAIKDISIVTSTGDINIDWTEFTYATFQNIEVVNTKANGRLMAATGNNGAGAYWNKFDGITLFGGLDRSQFGLTFWQDYGINLSTGPNANHFTNIKRAASLARAIDLQAGIGNLFTNIKGESISDGMIVLNDIPSLDDSGTSTSTGNLSLTDTSKTWSIVPGDADNHIGKSVLLKSGIAETCRKIISNTVDTLTLDKPWPRDPGDTVTYWILDNECVHNKFTNLRIEGLATDNPDFVRAMPGSHNNEFSHIESGSIGSGMAFNNLSQRMDNKVRQGDLVVQQWTLEDPGPNAAINLTLENADPRTNGLGGIKNGEAMLLVAAEMHSPNFVTGSAEATLTVDHGGITPGAGLETLICKIDDKCSEQCYVSGSQTSRRTAESAIHVRFTTNANVNSAADFTITLTYQVV